MNDWLGDNKKRNEKMPYVKDTFVSYFSVIKMLACKISWDFWKQCNTSFKRIRFATKGDLCITLMHYTSLVSKIVGSRKIIYGLETNNFANRRKLFKNRGSSVVLNQIWTWWKLLPNLPLVSNFGFQAKKTDLYKIIVSKCI